MSDDADNAELQIEQALARSLAIRKTEFYHTGFCMNCLEEIPIEQLFCNSSCHEDWERIEAARVRAGK